MSDDAFKRVREAHDEATDERKRIARRIRDQYEARILDEIETAAQHLYAKVGRIIAEELAAGLTRAEARRAIRTNSGDVWRRYIDAAEVSLPDKRRTQNNFMFDFETGWAWKRDEPEIRVPMFSIDTDGATEFHINDRDRSRHLEFDREGKTDHRRAEARAYLTRQGLTEAEHKHWTDDERHEYRGS